LDPIAQSKNRLQKTNFLDQGSEDWFKVLEHCLELNPNNAAALRIKSIWFTKTGDYVNAYSLLNRAVELDPFEALVYRGWLKLYKLHDYFGALNDFEKIISITKSGTRLKFFEDIYYLMGLTRMQLAQYKEAITAFDMSIQRIYKYQTQLEDLVYILVDKAICQLELGAYEDSLGTLEQALEVNGNTPECYYQKANALIHLGKKSEAKKFYIKALKLASQGKIRFNPYKDFFNQLYIEEISEKLDAK